MTRIQIFVFSVLHALGVLLLPLLITLLGGCLDVEKLETPPEALCEDVEFQLNNASAMQPNSLNVNDFVHTEETIAPLSNNPQITADVLDKVISVTAKTGNQFEVRKLQTVITYSNGQSHQETKESIATVPNAYTLCPPPEGVTYHGLQVFHRKMKATFFKTDCGSFANCEIEVTQVKFDQVYKNNGKQEVRKYDFTTSKDVPFVAMNLKSCISGTIDVNGQALPVTQCNRVKNFGNQN